MENCPVCGGKLIAITGYDYNNFCRKCDKLIFPESGTKDEEEK